MSAILAAVSASEKDIEGHLEFLEGRTSAQQEATLNLANAEIERWYSTHLPALQAIEAALPEVWYNPQKDDPALKIIDQKRRCLLYTSPSPRD